MLACACVSPAVFVWTLVLALGFLSVCMDSYTCACVSQCLYGLLYLRLYFSVFVWTLVLALLSFFMDSCACVSQFFYGLVLVFLSVCMDSCVFACVSQFLYGPLLRLRMRFSVFVWTLVLALVF